MNPDIKADLESLNSNANLLLELAGILGAGRPDHDFAYNAVRTAHPDVAAEVKRFTACATDQYQDAVALLAALSTKLRAAVQAYEQIDQALAKLIDDYLTNSTYVPPPR